MDPARVRTLDDLLEAIDHRPRDPAGRRVFDEALWAARGTDGAILVTDLSGFTRTTRAHGIVHFLSIFRRAERACVPIIGEHGGRMIKQEADDLIGAFPTALSALHAAIAMLEAVRAMNSATAEDEQIGMCIGVEFGRYLQLDDDAFGDPVNIAFKLGEDEAEVGEILVGAAAYRAAHAAGMDLSRLRVDGPRILDVGHVPTEHWSIRLSA